MELIFIAIGSIIYFVGVYLSLTEYIKRIGIWFLCPFIFPIVIIVGLTSWVSYVYMMIYKDERFL